MRFLKDFAIEEQIALDMLVNIVSENSNIKRKHTKIAENCIRKRFYNNGRVPEKLLESSGLSYQIEENGEITRGGDLFGNIFDDFNYGDATMVFDNPFMLDDKLKWQKVPFWTIKKQHKKFLSMKS